MAKAEKRTHSYSALQDSWTRFAQAVATGEAHRSSGRPSKTWTLGSHRSSVEAMPNPCLRQTRLERAHRASYGMDAVTGQQPIEAPSAGRGRGDRWPYIHALEIVRTMPIAKHVLPNNAQNRILHPTGEAKNVHCACEPWRPRKCTFAIARLNRPLSFRAFSVSGFSPSTPKTCILER